MYAIATVGKQPTLRVILRKRD